tara:strand:+ start:9599 stop:10231 length:633 start_codon:yes stop_codon:yes gene_type:complete
MFLRNCELKWTAVSLVVLLGLLTACTTNVVVEGSVPTPLVARIPANVGIYYEEGFKTFVHSEVLKEEGTWNIPLGEKNLSFFRNLMTALFDSVVEVESPELTDVQKANLDGVIIPKIEKYGFLTPNISGLKFYSASIHYRITLMDSDNHKVAEYVVVGYGKSEGGTFSSGQALGDATMLAIRDGGTRIAVGLGEHPAIVSWLAQREGEPK